jgi:hypothetical protein
MERTAERGLFFHQSATYGKWTRSLRAMLQKNAQGEI